MLSSPLWGVDRRARLPLRMAEVYGPYVHFLKKNPVPLSVIPKCKEVGRAAVSKENVAASQTGVHVVGASQRGFCVVVKPDGAIDI